MAQIKAIIDSLDGIEEALQGLYEEKDGKFVLSVEGINDHPEIKSLSGTMRNVKAEKQKLADDLKKAKERLAAVPEDFDADEYAQLRADAAARENDPDGKDVNKRIADAVAHMREAEQKKNAALVKKLEAEKTELAESNKRKDEQLRSRLVDDELTKALTESGITTPQYLKAAKAMLRSDVEVVEEDGVFVARMKSDLGGDEISRYVQTWATTDDGKAFVALPKGGSEGGGGKGGTTGPNPYLKAQWNMTDQGRLEKTDPGKADRLAKAAGFKDLAAAQRATGPIK